MKLGNVSEPVAMVNEEFTLLNPDVVDLVTVAFNKSMFDILASAIAPLPEAL